MIVLPCVGLVIVVAVQAIGVIVRFDVVDEEGFFVIGHVIEVAIGIGPTVVVLILARKDSIGIDGGSEPSGAKDVSQWPVGVTVAIVIVLDQPPVEGRVGEARQVAIVETISPFRKVRSSVVYWGFMAKYSRAHASRPNQRRAWR